MPTVSIEVKSGQLEKLGTALRARISIPEGGNEPTAEELIQRFLRDSLRKVVVDYDMNVAKKEATTRADKEIN